MSNITKLETNGAVTFADTSVGELKRLIKENLHADATDGEIQLLIGTAKQVGLDPLLKQVYLRIDPGYGNRPRRATVEISIGGIRAIATASGQFQGYTEPVWLTSQREWVDVWIPTDDNDFPLAAKCGVYRERYKEPCTYIATFYSYAQRKSNGELVGRWSNPATAADQLMKCAEAGALRKAFPQTGQLYTREEMQQADNAPSNYVKVSTTAPARTIEPAETVETFPQNELKALAKEIVAMCPFYETINKAEAKQYFGEMNREDITLARATVIRNGMKTRCAEKKAIILDTISSFDAAKQLEHFIGELPEVWTKFLAKEIADARAQLTPELKEQFDAQGVESVENWEKNLAAEFGEFVEVEAVAPQTETKAKAKGK